MDPDDQFRQPHRPASTRRRRARLIALALSVAVVGPVMLSVSSASAAPKPTVNQVAKKVKALREQAEQATEDYNNTQIQLKSINARLKASQVRLAREKVQLHRAQLQLGQLASETYQRGQLSTLDLVLGDDPSLALTQAGYLPTLSERQAGATNQLRVTTENLNNTAADIKAQQQKLTATNAKLGKVKSSIDKKLASANFQLNLLKGNQQAQAKRAANSAGSANVPAGAGFDFCIGKANAAPTAAAKTAITFACNQLNKLYEWGGTGPAHYDCSGLTMRAYGAAGIGLPHSSAAQAGYGTRVSFSQVQAGDLVFFGSPIHHVVIALGDGLMIHSPQSGDVVKIASYYSTPSAVVRLS